MDGWLNTISKEVLLNSAENTLQPKKKRKEKRREKATRWGDSTLEI